MRAPTRQRLRRRSDGFKEEFRESFRPFAPSVLREHVCEWFELVVTHVDYSARIQTVHKETNPRYHALIQRFNQRTGCPVIVNTSFNVRGEPIVGTPEDAFRCFMGTNMEVLAIGNCFLRKEDQDPKLTKDYKSAFDLD
jgi:carbamoyltransferase